LAEGIYNVTSLETPQEEEPPKQLQHPEDEPQGFDDNVVYEVNDEGGDGTERNEEGLQEMADTLSRDEKMMLQLLKEVDNKGLLHQETNKKSN
jgi:hypothetical protein